jgi:2-iminoacetate synthase
VSNEGSFISESEIQSALNRAANCDESRIREILAKGKSLRGLTLDDVAALMEVRSAEMVEQVFAAAREVKEEIYGSRIVLFAPLYVTSRCVNECSYCAFRVSNQQVQRRTLSQNEIAAETGVIVDQGHKRILLVAGEYYGSEGFQYVLDAIGTVYSVKSGRGEVRRVNVNVAPLTVEQFRDLKGAGIGTYQLFQETYHRETYASIHTAGPKRDFEFRLTAMDRAMEAGIDDVGIGPLFGLYDWKFEVLAMMQHIRHLEAKFGCGPHTISVPRLEPAIGSEIAARPPHAMSDSDFLKMVAILRLAVPYTGLIMSTRESAEIRRKSFQIGISQTSAGSRTDPGGYTDNKDHFSTGQFAVGDLRPLDEVVREISDMNFTPSFCTACYRSGRTGADFMDLAKPGAIKYHCEINALSTFTEYANDYASEATKQAADQHIVRHIAAMDERQRSLAEPMVARVRNGERDVLV